MIVLVFQILDFSNFLLFYNVTIVIILSSNFKANKHQSSPVETLDPSSPAVGKTNVINLFLLPIDVDFPVFIQEKRHIKILVFGGTFLGVKMKLTVAWDCIQRGGGRLIDQCVKEGE